MECQFSRVVIFTFIYSQMYMHKDAITESSRQAAKPRLGSEEVIVSELG